jgi:hypothetical protein
MPDWVVIVVVCIVAVAVAWILIRSIRRAQLEKRD